MEKGKIWYCKIGEHEPRMDGADLPMREAIKRAYFQITGYHPDFLFSGWSAELTEEEREVVESWPKQ